MTQENRMSPTHLHRIGQALVAVWCVILMVACGGAGELGSGGTGTGSSAALGTVTGLGSVFVDGVRFDDSNAAVQIDNLSGDQDLTEAKLGQRVELSFTVDGVAQTVRIEPEVIGVVSSVQAGSGFVVLGQTVVVNADPAAGPVTQFDGGYASLADVSLGDSVEVHGVPRSSGGVAVVQATRIETRVAPLAYLRVVGTVAGLAGSGTTENFRLGGLAVQSGAALVLPMARALSEGQSVVVLALPGNLETVGAGTPRLGASLVRIRERSNGPVQAYVGGAISNLGSSSFSLGSLRVNFSGSTEVTGGSLADGRYVQVRGDFAADGSLTATRIKLRDGLLDAELRGTAMAFDSVAKTFTVRDVPVNASTVLLFENCPADLSNSYVEVKGRLGLTAVRAETVKCTADPAGAIVERRGAASNTAPQTNSFTLTTATGPLTVRWTPLTFFRDDLRRTAASLNGKNLRVEGVFVGNALVATKVRLGN
jgi:Domain of unknown function (DUF5666)